jgi:hypothetical protein
MEISLNLPLFLFLTFLSLPSWLPLLLEPPLTSDVPEGEDDLPFLSILLL